MRLVFPVADERFAESRRHSVAPAALAAFADGRQHGADAGGGAGEDS